jgi:hypothetical protein
MAGIVKDHATLIRATFVTRDVILKPLKQELPGSFQYRVPSLARELWSGLFDADVYAA